MDTPQPAPVSPDETNAPTKEVREELAKVASDADVKIQQQAGIEPRAGIAGHAIGLLVAAAIYYVIQMHAVPIPERYAPVLERLALGVMSAATVLAAHRLVDIYLLRPIENAVFRYNLRRIIKLIVGLILVAIVLSVLFANWYAAAASLGIASVILGFALQPTVSSFIGWIYILTRKPFRVGDRIMINGAIGDVIDVTYLDTTLWEVGGQNMSADQPSGRIIKFPNANVLQQAVYNYSWPLFPYVWNEITFNVAYQSDLQFIEDTMCSAVEAELGDAMLDRARSFREILARTPVDDVNVRDRPSVNFRVNSNTWLDATVRYIVPPREAGRVKTRLVRRILELFNAAPDRAMLPMNNSR